MLTFGSNIDGYHDVADQMIDHLRRRAERCFERRQRERDGLKTLANFEAYRARMRENFLRAVGGLPRERTPLNATVTGTIDRGSYLIEKIVYHSLPEFPVTAALYMPKSRRGQKPGPAVLFVCGHAMEAKAYPVYQKVCIDLASDGFVVLAVDPVGQGERFQFIDERTGLQRVSWGTTEHTYAGIPFYALGMSIARHFIWDGMRGIDYLLTRPEVDPQKVGVTGNSGGGTQTVYLMMTEPRLAAAMPCTFVMDYESYLKTGQPQDGEQNLYACFADGPDHDDYITAMAPKPVRLGLAAYDFFPIEGSLASCERARKVYELFGAADKLDYAIAPTTHAYSTQLRHAAVSFFRKFLRGEAEAFSAPEPETLPPAELNATRTGQVLSSFTGHKTICDLRRQAAQAVLPATPRKKEAQRLRAEVADVLGIGADVPAGEACWTGEPRARRIFPRIIYNDFVHGYRTEKIFFFSEPEVCVTAIYSHPRDEAAATGTEIVLLEDGTNSIPAETARLTALLEAGRRVFVFDVRGIGALKARPITPGGGAHGPEFRLAMDAMKMKTSTLGLRVFDVLRAVDYLRTRSETGPIGVTAIGTAAAWGLYAAALEPQLASVRLEGLPLSYRAVAQTRYYSEAVFDMRTTAWGLLRAADVAELLAALAPRPVSFIQPVSATGVPLSQAEVARDFLQPAESAGLIGAWRPEIRQTV